MFKIKTAIKKFLFFTAGLFKRVPVLYAFLFLIFYVSIDYHDAISKAKGAALSRLMPGFEYLVRFDEGKENFDQRKFMEYVQYYRQLVEYMPYTADAYGMLGYCYYHLGRTEEAIASYQKAGEFNANYFWFYYNLGMVYFKSGRYAQAADAFRAAMETGIDVSLSFIYLSKVYLPVREITRDYDDTLHARLDAGYKDCYKMVVLSSFLAQDYMAVVGSANYAIREKFEDPYFYYFYAGIASYELKQYRVSVAFLQECIALNQDYTDAFHYLALGWQALGRADVASQIRREGARLGKIKSPHEAMREKFKVRIL